MYINYNGTEIEIEYEVSGDYYPATLETPAEYPEVEITAIYYKDVDVLDLLEFDLERIYELVNENYENI